MEDYVRIDGNSMTIEQVVSVARNGARVVIDEKAKRSRS